MAHLEWHISCPLLKNKNRLPFRKPAIRTPELFAVPGCLPGMQAVFYGLSYKQERLA